MNITVVRLHELTKTQLKAFSQWLRDEIRPDDKELGSDWVCQVLQKSHFWGDKRIGELAAKGIGTVDIWVALVDGNPAGTFWCVKGIPDRDISLFVADSSYSQAECLEISDVMALHGVKSLLDDDHPGKGKLRSLFPDNSEAAAYAKLCGFKPVAIVTTDIIKHRPLTWWEIDMRDLLENMQKRVEARRG